MSAPIIITVPNNYLTVDEVDSKVVMDVPPPPPSRKRRLDHLSWEEKMQRKKLKNRVAAQTSRDRKKAKMDEMEFQIKKLVEANERLTSEVSSLKALNERLLTGGAPDGDPRGTPAAGDVPALADLLQHLDSEEYLDTLHQLADSLLKEIDAGAAGAPEDVTVRVPGECHQAVEMVGSSAEHLESSEVAVIDLKHDVNRILSQHSYAHPYIPDVTATQPEETVQIKEDIGNDKGDIFYASFDEANDCITVEVPCDEQVVEELSPIKVETELNSVIDVSGVSLECNLKMLSPMSLSPNSADENLLLSPSHTSISDLGYESLASPLSEPDSMDLSDFWCESFSELFPGLA
ncbi:unnamed protein product [Chilo suppressalis]|uniref:X-box-binding protein 1 n=1 Tax=Chilo suppressalis TaxID=168631 RepID=A0ABN8BEU1_CHISP|nr:hypothetical protein evm_009459 [Chilo suppressalis]CAH0406660.1 unnamed protein product [Chilo suppressalis]